MARGVLFVARVGAESGGVSLAEGVGAHVIIELVEELRRGQFRVGLRPHVVLEHAVAIVGRPTLRHSRDPQVVSGSIGLCISLQVLLLQVVLRK
jgi:hypothetical protein